MKFLVYEVQDESRWRKWLYEVEAESHDDALELVQAGEIDPADYGEYGESDFGNSGFCVVIEDEETVANGWGRAADDMSI